MANAVKQGWIAFLLATGLVLALACLSYQSGQTTGRAGLAGADLNHPGPNHLGLTHVGMSHHGMSQAPTSLNSAETLQASASHPCCPPAEMDDVCVTLCMMASSFLAPLFLGADAPASCELVDWPAGRSAAAGHDEACDPPPPKSFA